MGTVPDRGVYSLYLLSLLVSLTTSLPTIKLVSLLPEDTIDPVQDWSWGKLGSGVVYTATQIWGGTAVSGEDTFSVPEETEDEVEMGIDFEFPEDLAPIEPIGSDPTTEIEEISPTETVESSPAEEIDYVALVLDLFNILSISSA
eukprot:TRINITY_DN29380_c0_g1_i1.p1 TRINITY_DN29380_c0_g1~~TRINITY_DN29380_c0_g1_i1.p1  ORF type:complete len:145 (-),score=43.88 TRINITY_DN29380_c0_g1_i1:57-491(-)